MLDVVVRAATPEDDVGAWLRASWGSTRIGLHGRLVELTDRPALLAQSGEDVCGVLVHAPGVVAWEILSLDVRPPGHGVGRALVSAVAELARAAGATVVRCTTTNDNTPAIGFWQAVGFRLVTLRTGDVAAARLLKPELPEAGHRGVPLRDELDLELPLDASPPHGRVTLVLEGCVPAGGQAALEAFLAEAAPFYEAPGGIRVRLHWDRSDPTRFREVVDYDSEADFLADDERTRSDETMRAFLARWRDLLAEDPSVSTWRPVGVHRSSVGRY
ncbi:MAG: GNAT family N-acetyltransferase [Nocardioidaceae bacterium]